MVRIPAAFAHHIFGLILIHLAIKLEAIAVEERRARLELEATQNLGSRGLKDSLAKCAELEAQIADSQQTIASMTELRRQHEARLATSVGRVTELEQQLNAARCTCEFLSLEKSKLSSELESDRQRVEAELTKSRSQLDLEVRRVEKASSSIQILISEKSNLERTIGQLRKESGESILSLRRQYNNLHERATDIIQSLEFKLKEALEISSGSERQCASLSTAISARDTEIGILKMLSRTPETATESMKCEISRLKALLEDQASSLAASRAAADWAESQAKKAEAELKISRDLVQTTIREKLSLQDQLNALSRAAAQSPSQTAQIQLMEAELRKLSNLYEQMRDAHEKSQQTFCALKSASAESLAAAERQNWKLRDEAQTGDIGSLLLERSVMKKRHVEEVSALQTRLAVAEESIQDQLSCIDRMLTEIHLMLGEIRKGGGPASESDSVSLLLQAVQDERERISSRCEIWDQVVAAGSCQCDSPVASRARSKIFKLDPTTQ